MSILTSCIKRWPSMALCFTIMLLITVPLLLLAIQYPDSLQQSGIIISHYHVFCTFFRWLFLAILFLIWPKMMRFYARKKHWPIEKSAVWIALRFRLLLWLILFEFMVNEQLVFALWHLWENR